MEVINSSKMPAGYTVVMQPDGHELVLVVVKGTFTLPHRDGRDAELAEEQAPLIEADQFEGEPGFSAPVYESDYAAMKHHCDVLLKGSAYATGGRSAARVVVALKVGRMEKRFAVIGNRTWKKGLIGVSATPPEPFHVMPISYSNAYGGVDKNHSDETKHSAFLPNPVGCGFHEQMAAEFINGRPLPNTEEETAPILSMRGNYKPMSFGPVGRGWQPRASYAGTYDQIWLDETYPFLPGDFDERYYQAAPSDQQTDHLQGGEEVMLTNLTPDGRCRFFIPRFDLPVRFVLRDRTEHEMRPAADTLVLEPDANRFILLWGAVLPLRRNIFEVERVAIGNMPAELYRRRPQRAVSNSEIVPSAV